MVIHEQDIDTCLHVTMLEGIIKDNGIGCRPYTFVTQASDTLTAVFVHRHVDTRKLVLHLIWFITDLFHWHVSHCKNVAFRLALVASA